MAPAGADPGAGVADGRPDQPVPINTDRRPVLPHDLGVDWVEVIVHPPG